MIVFAITVQMTIRSSQQRCSVRKVILRNFPKFTGKHLCQALLFNKVEDSESETLAQCFSVNFSKFLRTPFSQNISGRLLLDKTTLPSLESK